MGRFAPELYGDFVQQTELESRLNRFTTEVVDTRIAAAIEGSSGGAVISVPLISGPTTARDGTTITLTASATSLLVNGSIVSFTWTLPDGSTQTTPAVSGSASINVAVSGSLGETKTVSVKATDIAANQSQSASHVFAISDNSAPDVTNLTTNIPASIRVGETLPARLIAGATDPDGDTVTYTLFLPTGLTASKTTGINNNEPFSLTAAANMTVSATVTITIAARDGRGGEAQKLISLAIAAAVAPSGEAVFTTPGTYNWTVPDGVTSASALVVDGSGGNVGFGQLAVGGTGGVVASIHGINATPITSTTGFSLTAPTSSGSYGISSGVAAYDNDMPLTPGAQITVNVPGPDGAVRVIWGAGRSFPNNAASAGTQIGIVCTATGGGAGQWQRVDGNFNPVNYPFGGAFFNSHPTYAGIVGQTIDGQAMVKVPKFWFKTGNVPSGTYAGKRYWMISDQPAPGFAVHPAFMNYGAEVAQYWVGKYQGTDDGGNKLGSAAGVTPLVDINFPTMQARANARNTGGVTGFGLWNIYQLSAIQTLALIEIGGSDSKTLVGQGHISGDFALATDNATVAQATWRGIVGLWGNVFQMVDGLQTDASSRYKIWDKNGNKTYQTTSLTAPSGSYPVTMATTTGTDYDLATVFAAETANATAGNGTYGDRFYQNPSCVAYHGGGWRNGASVGLFCLYVYSAASTSTPYIGGRLAKV